MDNINELYNFIKRDIEYQERLNQLEIIGNKELREFYEINKSEVSFGLLKDTILRGYSLKDIKETIEKVNNIDKSITINMILSLNLEIDRYRRF